MSTEPREIMGTEAAMLTSTLIIGGTVPMDKEKASGRGVAAEVQAAEAEKEGDGKGTGKGEVVEVEKKDARKRMASRSEMWNHFEKVIIDGVLQKGKCNYCKSTVAVPISTVASESAFSTSGRILDEFRSSLTPFMVEVLVCTQDWLRYGTHVNIVENTEELSKLEQELIAEYKEKAKLQSNSKPPTTAKPIS